MTKKQMKKVAQEIAAYEKIHSDPASTEEEKKNAENNILYLTNRIFTAPNVFELMTEIDDLIQKYLKE